MRLRTCSGDLGTVVISVYFDHFSLMDFAHDDRISEGEFLRATGHYRRGQWNLYTQRRYIQGPLKTLFIYIFSRLAQASVQALYNL